MSNKQKIKGAEALLLSLIAEGTDTIFGYPGGQVIPIYDHLYHHTDRLNHILTRHEQGAVHAAQGYARATGKVGVCLATSGPGATNLVTGIADAMLDSTPIICITGQVPSTLLGTDAVQEADTISMTMPISKWNFQVTKASEIPGAIAKAYYIARTGRPGPVVVDITKDAQQEMAEYHYEKVSFIRSYCPSPAIDKEKIAEAAKLITLSRKPLALIGQGVILGGAEKELRVFLEKSGIPAASTLLGLSAIPSDHPQFVGMLGMHGNYAPNIKNKECDLLIAIGMRFDDRVTGNPEQFGINAKIIHLEIDPAEVNKIIYADVPVLGNVKETLPALTELVVPNRHTDWIAEFKACYNIEYQEIIEPALYPTSKQIRMGEVVDLVSKAYHHDAILVTDVGQQQMVASRYFRFKHTRSIVTSGGLGTMGFGLPAAIGAKIGAPQREVCLFVGDGGFQMNLQELGTIFQSRVPVKIILLNNSFLGMVRQWQELFFDKRYSFTEMTNPDFGAIAQGNGIAYRCVEKRDELETAIHAMKEHPGAFLLEVRVEPEENVFPMVPAGAAVGDVRLE